MDSGRVAGLPRTSKNTVGDTHSLGLLGSSWGGRGNSVACSLEVLGAPGILWASLEGL